VKWEYTLLNIANNPPLTSDVSSSLTLVVNARPVVKSKYVVPQIKHVLIVVLTNTRVLYKNDLRKISLFQGRLFLEE
jgi:hypothetical protein